MNNESSERRNRKEIYILKATFSSIEIYSLVSNVQSECELAELYRRCFIIFYYIFYVIVNLVSDHLLERTEHRRDYTLN